MVDKCEHRFPLLNTSSLIHEAVLYNQNLAVVENHEGLQRKVGHRIHTMVELARMGWGTAVSIINSGSSRDVSQTHLHVRLFLQRSITYY